MTRGRPARSDEVPRYGSVWMWMMSPADIDDQRYLVLTVGGRDLLFLVVGGRWIGEVSDHMIWFSNAGTVLDGWFCVDEGPG